MIKAIPMEDWLRGCIYHDGRHGYVTLPTDKVHQIANYIQRTRRSGMDGLIDLEVVEADRKTENSSEKPNNCEDLQDWKDRMWAEAIVTEPTISKMEQVDKDINVRSKTEPQNGYVLSKDSDAYKFNKRMEVEEGWLKEQSRKE